MSAEIVKVLRDAKERLETKGWCQGHFVNSEGECCAVGAVRAVVGGRSPRWRHTRRGERALEVLDLVVAPRTIVGFNDSPHTSKEDVLALFDKAIEAASQLP